MVVHFGLPCSSWVLLSRATTARTYLAPLGDLSVSSVKLGNLLCARSKSVLNVIPLYVWVMQNTGLFPVAIFTHSGGNHVQDVHPHLHNPSPQGNVHNRAALYVTPFSSPTISTNRWVGESCLVLPIY